MIPETEWTWHGLAGHFIGAQSCCFRMHTTVGEYRVSTVGCWHSGSGNPDVPSEIGSGRLYETMVFKLDDGEIEEWQESDSDAYNDRDAAESGHIAMCRKVAEGRIGWGA